jgi:hypothetical protein
MCHVEWSQLNELFDSMLEWQHATCRQKVWFKETWFTFAETSKSPTNQLHREQNYLSNIVHLQCDSIVTVTKRKYQ